MPVSQPLSALTDWLFITSGSAATSTRCSGPSLLYPFQLISPHFSSKFGSTLGDIGRIVGLLEFLLKWPLFHRNWYPKAAISIEIRIISADWRCILAGSGTLPTYRTVRAMASSKYKTRLFHPPQLVFPLFSREESERLLCVFQPPRLPWVHGQLQA